MSVILTTRMQAAVKILMEYMKKDYWHSLR
jgi:hypothetical protein